MQIFNPDNAQQSEASKAVYAWYELAYTGVDFMAALMFVIGSLLFFKAETTYLGTWLFLIGSVLFSLRPGVKLFREIALIRMGRYKDMGKDI